jgi:integrase
MAVYRKNETWWIDYRYKGRRYRQKIGTRKRDAEEALSQIKVKIAAGEFVPMEERKRQESLEPQSVLFETFAKEEFLPWSQMQHSANHHRRLESILRVHLIPFFGEHRLDEITTKRIEDYKSRRRRGSYRRGRQTKKTTDATINREICCLKVILRKAVEWGKLETSPAKGVKGFKETPNAPYLLEQNEIARLLEETPDHLKALIACAVYAGLRRSELFHLRWEDIKWNTGELHVVSRREHHTKNYESRRIPMNDSLVETLRRHPRRLKSPYVFANREGRPYDDLRGSINSAAKRAGIKGEVKMHQLRHAFCSHALMQGIDPRTVQKWMGHKTLQTTLRYAHVSPDHEKAAIQRLRYKSGHYMDTRAENGE